MKQLTFIEPAPIESKYCQSTGSPVYVPKNSKPDIIELANTAKTRTLISEIDEAEIPERDRVFLRMAAARHTVFHYERIADYYSHSTPEVQRLMEASALVIVDFDDAIERGYVRLCEAIESIHRQEVV